MSEPSRMIYIAFTERRYGTHIGKWAHTPFEGCIAYTRAASPDQTNGLLREALERAILAAENLIGELEAHQENTGEFLEPEDQGVVDVAKADLTFAKAALASTPTARIEESEPMKLTDDQIKHMTERFLSWRLPENFNPDNGITAKRPNYAPNVVWEPSGTNLLDYTQAEAMVRHMAEGLPPQSKSCALDW